MIYLSVQGHELDEDSEVISGLEEEIKNLKEQLERVPSEDAAGADGVDGEDGAKTKVLEIKVASMESEIKRLEQEVSARQSALERMGTDLSAVKLELANSTQDFLVQLEKEKAKSASAASTQQQQQQQQQQQSSNAKIVEIDALKTLLSNCKAELIQQTNACQEMSAAKVFIFPECYFSHQ